LARRTLRVRLLAFVIGSVLFVVALELASFVLFYAAAGRRFSYAAIAREEAAEVAAWTPPTAQATPPPTPTVAAAPQTTQTPAVEGRPESTLVDLVPHPFMGFVYNPEDPRLLAAQGGGALPLTEHGFFDLQAPPGGGEELSVAVFGGSVAVYFWFEAREAMTRVLQADPRLRNRRVYVRCFALGGFKQPQMLGALAYLMALGERFDVVVELDGFNDVALSSFVNKNRGIFPAYPRDWDGLVAQAPDLERQRTIGKVAFLQEWRARVARGFAKRPFSWSVTGGLVWKSIDRFFGGELARDREALTRSSGGGNRYRERGPVRRYGSDQERLADIVRLWGLSSVQMSHLCAGAATRYYHFLQPNQYLPGSKPMSEAEKAVAYRANHLYRPAVEAGYPLLQAEGARLRGLGVDFHDLSGLYAGISEPLYIDDCCHVNARGNALMGEAVGKAIVAGWRR
jgi:hypothetical protein